MDEIDTPENSDEINGEIDKTPLVVKAARWLFILLGVIWIVFGVWSTLRVGSADGNVPVALLWIIIILMFVNALLLIWIAWGIGTGNKIYYYFGILVLAANIFLTFTDEFGLFDLLTLIVNIILLVLLIVTRSKYLTDG
ncbi:MAG: hypothetical protein WA997_10610 [Anaerolineales bacterium]